MSKFRSIVRWLVHQILFYGYYRRRLAREAWVTVSGLRLRVKPSVMNPVCFKTGRYFAEYLAGRPLTGRDVLDMGTGSGVLALVAARNGARVIAADINPEAVECAEQNARANGFGESVSVVLSDFFANLPSSGAFDLILFTPAYLKGTPAKGIGQALYGGENLELLDPFFEHAARFLSREGQVLMLVSTDADIDLLERKAAHHGYSWIVGDRKKGVFEDFLIVALQPRWSA